MNLFELFANDVLLLGGGGSSLGGVCYYNSFLQAQRGAGGRGGGGVENLKNYMSSFVNSPLSAFRNKLSASFIQMKL